MYKIKSCVSEVKVLCNKYLKKRKEVVKNKRVKFIHEIINTKTLFGKRKYKSVKDVIRYMKKTGDLFGSIWDDLGVRGSYWSDKTRDLLNNISSLPDDRDIWLTEEMCFLFKGE